LITNQPESTLPKVPVVVEVPAPSGQKYGQSAVEGRSGLSAEELEKLVKAIVEYMDLHQPFLNPQLTVNEFATHFKVHPQRISAVIKEAYSLTFPEFINTYRLQKLDELILKASKREKYTLDSLSAMAGFGSRNSFYNSFRKLRKTTPGEYYKLKGDGEVALLQVP
jgi:AraC-like DNA-binding protein